MSCPVVLRNHPLNGMRSLPCLSMSTDPVEMTPPPVATPTTLPRLRVLMACVNISAFEKEF